jgi:hypothetical protein
MRVLGIIVIILGLASLVLGIMFIPQAANGRTQVVKAIQPLTLSQINSTYDTVQIAYDKQMAKEEPGIQGGTAMPSALYDYYAAQYALAGLAKANIGTVDAVRMNGIVDIILGLGLCIAGFVMMRKPA